jgi:hypothetical protein
VCSRVDILQEKPTIDLSPYTFIEPYALIYLGMFLRHYNLQRTYFTVIHPISSAANDYLARQNFWKRFNFNPDPDNSDLRFYPQTSLNDIIDLVDRIGEADNVSQKVESVLQANTVKVNIGEITVAVAELVQNFVEHADQGLAAMMVQYYPNKKNLRLAIGDCGIGIKESLYRSGAYPELAHMTHKEAIVKAFAMKVTSKTEGGMGLDCVYDITKKLGAELFLSSGNGCVYVDNHGKLYMMDAPYNLTGVQVEMCFPERIRR